MDRYTRYLAVAGRVLLGSVFMLSGVGKLFTYGLTTDRIISAGLPVPPAAWLTAVLIEAGGGLLMVLGYRVRVVALVQAGFVMVAAVSFHRNFADQNQMIHFLENLMIIAGLLQIAHFGAGALSLDARRSAKA